MFRFASGILLAVLPLAVATPTPAPEATLSPIVWELIELPSADAPQQVTEPERYTIQFLPNDTLAVRADCNQSAGVHQLSNGSLALELRASTLVLCPPDSLADQFTSALEIVEGFAYADEGHLLLETPDGPLRFRPSLGGVRWEWQELQSSDDSVIAPPDPERYTLEFQPNGQLSIQADCNRGRGEFALDDPTLELRVRGVTRAFCGEESLMNDYLRDLEAVSSFVFRDGRLYLALKMDAGIMVFEARAIEPAATPVAGNDG